MDKPSLISLLVLIKDKLDITLVKFEAWITFFCISFFRKSNFKSRSLLSGDKASLLVRALDYARPRLVVI